MDSMGLAIKVVLFSLWCTTTGGKCDCRRYKSVLFAALPADTSRQNITTDALPETFWECNDNVIVYRSQRGNFPLACPLSGRSLVVNNPLVYSTNRISVLFPHAGPAQSILTNAKNGGGVHMMWNFNYIWSSWQFMLSFCCCTVDLFSGSSIWFVSFAESTLMSFREAAVQNFPLTSRTAFILQLCPILGRN